jgi:phosphomannomutase
MGEMSLDKDGIRTLATFGEMAYSLAAEGKTIEEQIAELYHRYGYHKMVNSYFSTPSPEKMSDTFAHVRGLFTTTPFKPFTIASKAAPSAKFNILHVRDLTLGYDSSTPDTKPDLYVDPNAHMLTFTFEHGHVCTLRGSGTEPKLKYYVETYSTDEVAAERQMHELTAAVIDTFLKPEQFGLIAPKI